MTPQPSKREEPTLLDLGRAAAAKLSGDWQLEAEADGELPVEAAPAEPPPPVAPYRPRLFPSSVPVESPPPADEIVEAMLFVGGPALTPSAACAAVRGLTPEQFQVSIDALNRKYRTQRRPYQIQPRDGGFLLTVLPAYRRLRERFFGGPKEARLSQPALEVLAVIVYQQPITKAEMDAVRGADSGILLRQLVRLGLVAVRHRADANQPEVRYGTTSRLLSLFGLKTLDELPRLGETEAV